MVFSLHHVIFPGLGAHAHRPTGRDVRQPRRCEVSTEDLIDSIGRACLEVRDCFPHGPDSLVPYKERHHPFPRSTSLGHWEVLSFSTFARVTGTKMVHLNQAVSCPVPPTNPSVSSACTQDSGLSSDLLLPRPNSFLHSLGHLLLDLALVLFAYPIASP